MVDDVCPWVTGLMILSDMPVTTHPRATSVWCTGYTDDRFKMAAEVLEHTTGMFRFIGLPRHEEVD